LGFDEASSRKCFSAAYEAYQNIGEDATTDSIKSLLWANDFI